VAADGTARNNVAFLRPSTAAEQQQGGAGSNIETWRNRDEYGLTLEYWLDTSFGSHSFKGGYTQSDNEYQEDLRYTSADLAQYTSIGSEFAGVTFADFVHGDWSGSTSISGVDIPRIQTAIDGSADRAYYLGLLDTNNDGSVSNDEIGAYPFTSTAGNPTGQVNNYRIVQSIAGPCTVKTKGNAFYLQDAWTLHGWTVNAGIRAEQWWHHSADGRQLVTFDWEFAPRLSVVYDSFGDGRSKLWGFYGRYYDPIRTNMTDFAGNLTGSVYDEQIFLGDRWLTFRTRGGPTTPDAVFAPSTKTPYTDEFMLGYATTFGQDLSLQVTYTNRKTKDILEDYDLGLYSN